MIDRKMLGIGFLLGLTFAALSWAMTADEIWQSIYDSATHSIRVTSVP